MTGIAKALKQDLAQARQAQHQAPTVDATPAWVNITDVFGQSIGIPYRDLPDVVEALKRAQSERDMKRLEQQ